MKKSSARHHFLLAGSSLFLLLAVAVALAFVSDHVPTAPYSSEFGVYDTSPKGEKGGRSVPASCELGIDHGGGCYAQGGYYAQGYYQAYYQGYYAPALPELYSSHLQRTDGLNFIEWGVSQYFRAQVNNVGNAGASGFNDIFRWYNNASSAWIESWGVGRPQGLGPNSFYVDFSGAMAFWTPGPQWIGHCVDYYGQVGEGNEGNNCSQRNYQVTSALSVSCSAAPASVQEDATVTWTASVSGGSGGYSYQWSGTDSLSGVGNPKTKVYVNSGTKTASVVVTDSLGRSSGSVPCSSMTVIDNDPTANIRARALGSGGAWSNGPLTIAANDEVELEWSSTNATSCTGDTYYSTGSATSGSTGSVAEAAAGQPRTYTVSCSKPGETAQDTVLVNRNVPANPPTLTANPDRVRVGETATLSGNLNGHTGCTITGGATNISVPDGTTSFSYDTAAIQGETTLTLECVFGEASDVVRILPSVEHI